MNTDGTQIVKPSFAQKLRRAGRKDLKEHKRAKSEGEGEDEHDDEDADARTGLAARRRLNPDTIGRRLPHIGKALYGCILLVKQDISLLELSPHQAGKFF
jgi:hypothetical protein